LDKDKVLCITSHKKNHFKKNERGQNRRQEGKKAIKVCDRELKVGNIQDKE